MRQTRGGRRESVVRRKPGEYGLRLPASDGIERSNPRAVESPRMAEENGDEESEPTVTLGDGEPVEGAPLARVASRLTWGIERSEVQRREGDTVVRTGDGPRELGDVLDEVEETYFDSRKSFEGAVREIIGYGPVPTADE